MFFQPKVNVSNRQLQGLEAFPADHALHTGMGFGPSSVPAARNAFRDCDAMLAVGTRFAEICTGSYGAVPPEKLVHIDINPGALGRNHPTPVAIHADSRDAVPMLAQNLQDRSKPRDYSQPGSRNGKHTIRVIASIPAASSAPCVPGWRPTPSSWRMTATTRS